ncbi:MAG TPA: thiamine diphosphokinase [Candidatus Limnocylindria bacterium]|nr:thiamine diphosphokinase [Candidatus Limnocylindria bacterium]
MRAVVVAHGDALPADRAHAASADLLIAADGGALLCSRWDLLPRIVVGDLDSLGVARAEELGRAGVRIVAYPADKDESDTELAVRSALEAGADEVILVAALGGERLDHELANILLVADPRLAGRIGAVRGDTRVSALHSGGTRRLAGAPGDVVTLLPVGDASGVTTDGLRYALRGEALRAGAARGLSNVVERAGASVTVTEGTLIVIEISRGGVQ